MNGYKLHADSYRRYLTDNPDTDSEAAAAITDKIKALDVMSELTRGQRMELFNTGGFNNICRGYLQIALDEAGVDDHTRGAVSAALDRLFDGVGAAQAEQRVCGR